MTDRTYYYTKTKLAICMYDAGVAFTFSIVCINNTGLGIDCFSFGIQYRYKWVISQRTQRDVQVE